MSNRRINARVRTPQAPGGSIIPDTDLHGRPTFTGLNEIKNNSPLAQMGREIRTNTIGRTPLMLPDQGGMFQGMANQGMGQGSMMTGSGRDAAGNRMSEPMLPNEAMFGSERDEAGNRVNYDKNGNVVRVQSNRINARVRTPQAPGGPLIPDTDLHGRPTFTGLNQIKYNSPLAQMGREMGPAQTMLNTPTPLAQMGREMGPAQTMLNTPMDDEDEDNNDYYDPFIMAQAKLKSLSSIETSKVNQSAWNHFT